jgi:hypothetical protein
MTAKNARTTAPKDETVLAITRTDGGFFIPDGFILQYNDSKTGVVKHRLGSNVHPNGIDGMLQNGHKRKHQDCHSGIHADAVDKDGKKLYTKDEVKPKAIEAQAAVWKAVAAGTWTISTRTVGDPVIVEVIDAILKAEGIGRTKFERDYGKGEDGVDVYTLKQLKSDMAAKSKTFDRKNPKHREVLLARGKKMRDDAKVRLANAQKGLGLPDLPDDL